MFAEILAWRTMLAVEIATETNKTAREYPDVEEEDDHYANQGEVSKWIDGSYATSCKDYAEGTCHHI
jgi:hypothetical protein